MKSLVHTEGALLPERAPGAKPRSETPRVYRPSVQIENIDLFVCVVDATVEYCTTINIFTTEITL